jgi:hypothetical protein
MVMNENIANFLFYFIRSIGNDLFWALISKKRTPLVERIRRRRWRDEPADTSGDVPTDRKTDQS